MSELALAATLYDPQTSNAKVDQQRRSHYRWVLALAVLDVVFTSCVLATGGHELNALARVAIEHAGIVGMILIKVLTLGVVFAVCEYLADQRPKLGHRIVQLALAGNAAAAACGAVYLVQFGIEVLRCTLLA